MSCLLSFWENQVPSCRAQEGLICVLSPQWVMHVTVTTEPGVCPAFSDISPPQLTSVPPLDLDAHLPPAPLARGGDLWEAVWDFPEAFLAAGSACAPRWNAARSFPRHPGEASWGLCAWLFWSIFLSHTPPCGIHPIKTLQSAAFTLRGSECLEGPLPRHTMAARTVPHAYPMSSEYEFANPSKIYDQNFGEGKKGDGIPPCTCLSFGEGGLVESPWGV